MGIVYGLRAMTLLRAAETARGGLDCGLARFSLRALHCAREEYRSITRQFISRPIMARLSGPGPTTSPRLITVAYAEARLLECWSFPAYARVPGDATRRRRRRSCRMFQWQSHAHLSARQRRL